MCQIIFFFKFNQLVENETLQICQLVQKLSLSFLFYSIVTESAIKLYPVSCFRNIMQVNLNTKLSSNCMAGICGKRVHNLKIKWTPFPLFDSLPLLCSKNTSKLEAFHLHFKTFAKKTFTFQNICSKQHLHFKHVLKKVKGNANSYWQRATIISPGQEPQKEMSTIVLSFMKYFC